MNEATMKLKVLDKYQLSPRVVGLTLGYEDNNILLPVWQPGSHVQVLLNTQDEPCVRQYSLCSSHLDLKTWQIAILKEAVGRGGSKYIHDNIQVGDELEVGEPKNHFSFKTAEHCLFIAGGIGITPIIAMIREAVAKGLNWHLVYLAQQQSDFIFKDELEQLDVEQRIDFHASNDHGIFDLTEYLKQFDEKTTVYSCGPQGLLDALEQIQLKNTWKLVVERFAVNLTEEVTTGKSFDVALKKSGKRIHVLETETILEALKREGIKVTCSCQSGTCGTCETVVLAGTPEHRDFVLSEEERELNETMMICVSRALSAELVLDL